MTCCRPIGNSTTDSGGGDDNHRNIGTGVDVFKVGTDVDLRRIHVVETGDLHGSLRIEQDPAAFADTNLLSLPRWLVQDNNIYASSSGSIVTALSGSVSGVSGFEDWFVVWSCKTCVTGSAHIHVFLEIDGTFVDDWYSQETSSFFPSPPDCRALRVNTDFASDPLSVRVLFATTSAGEVVYIEDITVFGLLFDET
ncbi:MAG: hypothetical protein B7733_18660 [Myxococcales bacterium FL481]|nr:MAG: hypothetical protein B7733_18660 [Myxococcales bacterium FL481]